MLPNCFPIVLSWWKTFISGRKAKTQPFKQCLHPNVWPVSKLRKQASKRERE